MISLARIGQLELLPVLFDDIVLPHGVFEEVTQDSKLPGAEDIARAEWLRVVEVSDREAVERLTASLDEGESQVLALAQELGATAAIDERRGRRLAASLGVPQTGTVGILLLAKKRGLIPALTPLLDQLGAKGVYLSPRLYEEARSLAGEA